MLLVADASPLISLLVIDRMDVLVKLYPDFVLPEAVWNELREHRELRQSKEMVMLGKHVRKVASQIIEVSAIDKGEREAIALYKELKADLLLIDDKKAREAAEFLDVRCIGTLALLYQAKQKGLIKKLAPVLDELIKKNRYYSQELIRFFLMQADEL